MIFNKAENGVELNINDEIGFWGISHQEFTNQLAEVGDKDIQLNIASYGGVVTDAFAIYNSLKSHNGRITANIYGDSASSATFIAMAADEIRIADNAMFLIHNVWGMVTGDSAELRKQAEMMDKLNNNIIDVYKKKTGLNKNTIKSLMNKEEWWTAKEAKANGFVDTVVEPENIINRSEAVLMNCANNEMKQALLEKVNKLNNNKNQFQMTEENKSWLSEKFDELKNSFVKTEEPTVEPTEEPKEDTLSKDEVSEMLNSVKEDFSNSLEAVKNEAAAKDEEISKLKAELEKKNAQPTTVKAESKNPEEEVKEETASCSNLATLFANRMNQKFGGVVNFKTK